MAPFTPHSVVDALGDRTTGGAGSRLARWATSKSMRRLCCVEFDLHDSPQRLQAKDRGEQGFNGSAHQAVSVLQGTTIEPYPPCL